MAVHRPRSAPASSANRADRPLPALRVGSGAMLRLVARHLQTAASSRHQTRSGRHRGQRRLAIGMEMPVGPVRQPLLSNAPRIKSCWILTVALGDRTMSCFGVLGR